MTRLHSIIGLSLAFSITSCRMSDASSNVQYIKLGSTGMVTAANSPSVTICTNNDGRASDIQRAAGMWFAALGKSPQIQILNGGTFGQCASWVNFESLGEGASYTQVTENPVISINQDSEWFNSFAVMVHEFGHAFGLADTYNQQSKQSGDCVQPEPSVMCSPNFAQPQDDDIRGVRSVAGLPEAGGPVDFSNLQNTGTTATTGTSGLGGITFNPLNPNNALGTLNNGMTYNPASCAQTVQATLVQTSDGARRIGIPQTFAAKNLSICLGNAMQCSDPHFPRLMTQPAQQGEMQWFVTSPLPPAAATAFVAGVTITIDGVLLNNTSTTVPTSAGVAAQPTAQPFLQQTTAPFRCETMLR